MYVRMYGTGKLCQSNHDGMKEKGQARQDKEGNRQGRIRQDMA